MLVPSKEEIEKAASTISLDGKLTKQHQRELEAVLAVASSSDKLRDLLEGAPGDPPFLGSVASFWLGLKVAARLELTDRELWPGSITPKLRAAMNAAATSPARVVVDAEGLGVSTDRALEQYGITVDVVFLRDDGWTLGAPFMFEDVAYGLWHDKWVAYSYREGDEFARVYPISQYQRTGGMTHAHP